MEYIFIPVALVVIVAVWFISGLKATKELKAARKDRAEIYRSCFLRGLAGILAKMAKADGTVTLEEVSVASKLFNDMGLSEKDRELCYDSFKTAKDANLPMSYYASLFAPYSTKDSRKLIYEILWDITAADGKLDPGEAETLKTMIDWLSLDPSEYDCNAKRCEGRFVSLSDAAKAAGAKIDQILNA